MAQDVPFQWTKIVQENEMTQNEAKFGWEVKPKQQVLCMLCSPIAFWITYSILGTSFGFWALCPAWWGSNPDCAHGPTVL